VNHWTVECTKSNDTTKSKDKSKDKTKKIKHVLNNSLMQCWKHRKLTGNHYKWIFDPGANINVICNDELVTNIRKIEKQSANGIGGPATFTEVGDHPLFKECFINRERISSSYEGFYVSNIQRQLKDNTVQ
jgi:hypothetical protein